ncbi:MAG: sulfite exporter TauE/SafE family protein [Pseudomonadota bacterium]
MAVSTEVLILIAALIAAGSIAGITAGLFGNGGGFVVVPALIGVFSAFYETDSQLIYVAIGTSLASIVVASARSVQSHNAKGAVDFQVLKSWSAWLVIGVVVGLLIASVTNGERLFVVFAVGVLIYSIYFLFPNLFTGFGGSLTMPRGATRAGLASFLGGFSALLGIGGGTVTVATMVMCNRPVHQAVATAAGVGFIIGLPGAVGFLLLGLGEEGLPFGSVGYINIPALLAICAASIFTAPVGANWAHKLNDLHLKRMFGVYLVVVSASMFYKSMYV